MSENPLVASRLSYADLLAEAPKLLAEMSQRFNVSVNMVMFALMSAAELQGGPAAARYMNTVTLYMIGELVCEPGQ